MSCGDCGDRKPRTGGMTRSEFLGVGAATAVSLGVTGAAARADQTPCDAKPPRCGSAADLLWSIRASELQVLWGDLFPRMVASQWLNTGQPNNPLQVGQVTSSQLDNSIQDFVNWLINPSYPNAPTAPQTAGFNTTSFGKRVNLLLQYLGSSDPKIPMRYMGAGAFDFILSDSGIDLFAPFPPDDEQDLLRFYEFRNPGRPTIGIPQYMVDPQVVTFDVQSPEGPSQVWTSQNGFTNTPISAGCTLQSLTCLETSEEARRPEATGRLGFVPYRRFTVRGFFAAASKSRCWQLEGSVYRGILEQLPRVVATYWREQLNGFTVSPSYHYKWNNGLVRNIFAERLETSLPDDMVFDRDAMGQIADVEISNRGIRFPDIAAPPAWDRMVTDITAGRAGNPVFTDTRRPPPDW